MSAPSAPPEMLTSLLSRYSTTPTTGPYPRVTLTFAQSLDAKIAGERGKQLILSGKESLLMTHWMRTMHDAILVGIGTALNDDPQLNARLLPPPPPGQRRHLPRPVILDTRLRLTTTCKLLVNYGKGAGRRPWVICVTPPAEDSEWNNRLRALEAAGAKVIQIPSSPRTHETLTVSTVLETLYDLGIRTLMVEGGARVISSFLAETSNTPVVDSVIVTVAPVFVGDSGVGYNVPLDSTGFKCVRTEIVGRDVVVAMVYS